MKIGDFFSNSVLSEINLGYIRVSKTNIFTLLSAWVCASFILPMFPDQSISRKISTLLLGVEFCKPQNKFSALMQKLVHYH